jgi:hypothetical protein
MANTNICRFEYKKTLKQVINKAVDHYTTFNQISTKTEKKFKKIVVQVLVLVLKKNTVTSSILVTFRNKDEEKNCDKKF